MLAQPHCARGISACSGHRRQTPPLKTIEPLETRIVPASVIWDGGGDGANWHDPANWNNNQVPVAGDDVTIDPAGDITVNFSTGALALNSLNMPGDDGLSLTGGSLVLSSLSTLHDVALSGNAALSASTQITLTGSGSISAAASLHGPGVFINEGVFSIAGGDPDLLTEFQNEGEVVHGNAYLDFNGAAGKLRVLDGGIYTAANTASDWGFRQFNGGLGIFVEAGGTFRQDSPNASRFLTNTGNAPGFRIEGGSLELLNGTLGVNTGGIFTNVSITAAATGAVNFLNGAGITMTGAITGTGAGAVNFTEGAFISIGAAGATFDFSPGLLNWSSNATINGAGILTNNGQISIPVGDPNLEVELRNSGTILHGNAYLDFTAAIGKLRTLDGGLYITQNTVSDWGIRQFNGGLGIFIENGGTFRHASPNGSRFLTNTGNAPGFHADHGTIEVINGTLGVNGPGNFDTVEFNIATGAALNFLNGSNITLTGDFTTTGGGTITAREGASFSVAAAGATFAFPAGSFALTDNATIHGPGVLVNTGTIAIVGGDPNLRTELQNFGTITHGNAFFDIDAATGILRVLDGGAYISANTTADWGIRQFNGGQGFSIEPGGTFRHQSPSGVRFLTNTGNAPAFNVNGGTLEVVSGTLGINTSGQFTNVTIIAGPNAALTFLNGASIAIAGTITGTGDGTVALTEGSVLNVAAGGASFDFVSGMLRWNAAASIGGSGTLDNLGSIVIPDGDPNLRTTLRNFGIISHGNAHLDFEALGANVRVMPGGLYLTTNTITDYGFRQFNGGFGITIEAAGTFRHHSSNGARFLSNTGNNPSFNVLGGTVEVLGGTLAINSQGQLVDATIHTAAGAAFNFLNGSSITVEGTLTGTGKGTVNLTESGLLAIAPDGATFAFPSGQFHWNSSASVAGPGMLLNTGFIQITGGDPNLRAQMRSSGTIVHGNAHFDFEAAGASVRIMDGGVYITQNTASDLGFRQFNGGLGIFVEGGGTFRHDSPNNARFLSNTGNNPTFSIDGGKIEVLRGTLGINSTGTLNNATIHTEANGAVNFLSGSNVAVTGTVTGTGGGVVNLMDGGSFAIGVNGATLNFPANIFRWSGAGTIGGQGSLTNAGEIRITGGDPNLQTELINAGTIIHGDAYLDTDAAAGKLRIVDGGLYITANSATDLGFRQFNGGQGVFVEPGGTFRHDSPNGARFLTNVGNNPTFSNLGTVEVVKGTFFINSTLPQFAAGNLSGGAWDVKTGATLSFNNANVASLGASTSISVNGTGTLVGLSALTQSAGTLRLLGGADFTTAGTFTNDGTLALGPGTIFTANAFTQSASGTVQFQIGGVAAGLNGKLVVTNQATLAGTAWVDVVGGFGSVAGQAATLMTYASRSGTFANIEGLSIGGIPYFEANTGATAFVVTAIRDAADLRPENITGSESGFLGRPVTITFTVRNLEDVPTLTSSWVDAVYLSTDGFLDENDVLIGTVSHSGTLGPGGTYTATLTAPLPPVIPGEYQLLVVVDDQFGVPDSNRFNNAVAGEGPITTDLEHITHGVTEVTEIGTGQNLYYQIDSPPGRDILLTATLGTAGAARFYAKLNAIPTALDFDISATSLTELQQKLALFGTSELPYFLLIEGAATAGGGTSVSLSTRELGFEIVGTSPQDIPNVGTQEITISGSHFTASTTVRLVDAAGNEVVPTSVVLQNSNTLIVQFSAGTLLPGLFDVRLTDSGAVTAAENVVRVVPAQVTHSGLIAADERWFGGLVHYVTGPITVPVGVTLTIDPGAIIKFAPSVGMQVNGAIIADGTLAQPIVFTSIRDDAHGGDTNSDGIASAPLAGDWGTLAVDGTGVFDHAQLLFGGGSASGSWSATAALRSFSGSVMFTNSAVKDAFFDGILAWGGAVTIENSIFARIDRGVSAHPGSALVVKSSTFDDNRIGLLIHGGSLDVSNSIVYNSTQHGILFDYGSPSLAIRNTDIFSTVPGSANVGNLPNPIGTNGNISADPKFKNPSLGDYRLNFLSPAIDSANGSFAPATDARGLARYDDPRVANTGAGSPVFADMGALEFVENAPSPLDLVVTSVSGEPLVTGGTITRVTWTLQNRGTEAIRGAWHDTLQLVSNDGTVILTADTVLTSATLAAGQSATFAADVRAPYGTEGQYRWQVKTNSAGEIFEGQNSGNNLGTASERSALEIPVLPVGGNLGGTFSTVGNGILYKLEPTPGSDVRILLDRVDTGLTEIFLGIGSAPTRTSFFEHVSAAADPNARIEISGALDTDYYVLFVPRTLPGGAAEFSVGATLATFNLDGLGLDEGSNTGRVTIPLHGSQFGTDLTARLIAPDGITLDAQQVLVQSSTLAYATFDLTEADPGAYDIFITTQGQTDSLNDAFEVIAGTGGDQIRVDIVLPERVRVGRAFTGYIEYTNVGDTDAFAPLIRLTSPTGNEFRIDPEEDFTSTLSFLAISEEDGHAGTLRPGETVRMAFQSVGRPGTNTIQPEVGTPAPDAFDFATLREALRPEVDEGYDERFTEVISGGRSTVADYYSLLSAGATLWEQRNGEPTRSVVRVIDLLLDESFIEEHTRIRGKVFVGDTLHAAGGVLVNAINVETGAVFSALSDADGTVRFLDVSDVDPARLPDELTPVAIPAGTYRFTFEDLLTPAGLPVAVVPASGEAPAQTWVVQRGGTIHGRAVLPVVPVVDPDAPEPVIVAVSETREAFTAAIAPDGSYRIEGLPDGRYEVSLPSLSQFVAPLPFSGIEVRNGQVIALDELVGVIGGSVSGIVLGPGGIPIEGARVTAGDETDPVVVLTDENGFYQLDHIRPGAQEVRVSSDRFGVSFIPAVPVSAGQVTSGQNFSLVSLALVEGVVSSGGLAVAGARVELLDDEGEVFNFDVTDAQGFYELENLPAGDYTLRIDSLEHAVFSEAISLTAGEEETHDAALGAASIARGFVTNGPADKPLPGVTVQLVLPNDTVVTGFTDDTGAFFFSRIPAGDYTLMLPDGSHRQNFTIAGAGTEVDIDIDLEVGALAGKVLLDDGVTPNAGAFVALMKDGRVLWSTLVGPEGDYAFTLVSPGTYQLAVADEEFDYAIAGVTVGVDAVATVPSLLPGSASLDLSLASDGQPPGIAGFAVITQLDIPNATELSNLAVVPPSGVLTVEHLVPGEYLVQVYHPGYAEVHAIVTVGAGTTTLALATGQAGTVAGTITGPGGAPAGGVTVTLFNPVEPRIRWQVETAPDGSYSLPALPPGNYSLFVGDLRAAPNASDLAHATVGGVSVVAGQTTTRNAVLSAADITVSGSIADGTLHLPSNGYVTAYDANGLPVALADVDIHGQFTFNTLAPGSYTFRVEVPGFAVEERSRAVTAGENVTDFNFAADWLVDPHTPNEEASPGILAQAQAMTFQVLEGLRTLFDRPDQAPHVGQSSFSLLPPDCPCPKAVKWWQIAVQTDRFAYQVFEQLEERWEANVVINLSNFGLFASKLGITVGQIIIAKGQLTSSPWHETIRLNQGAINSLEGTLGVGVSDLETFFRNAGRIQELEAGIASLTRVIGQVPSLAGFGASAGVGGANLAINDGKTSVQLAFDAIGSLASAPSAASVIGAIDALNSLVNDVNTLVQFAQFLQTAGGPASPLTTLIGNITNILSPVTEGISGLLQTAGNIMDYMRMKDMYDRLIAERDTAARNHHSAIIECILDCEDLPNDNPPVPEPPDRTYRRPPPDNTDGVGSFDPNDKLTVGYGDEHYIRPGTLLPYTVRFENVASASAAAQVVTVTDQLSANLDWSTVELGDIGFNGIIVDVPEGLTHFETVVTVSTDANPVRVIGNFDPATGILSWAISSFDPVTGDLPEDPLAGFLPPNNPDAQGEGFVSYSVKPLSTLTTGDVISNQARIIFDVNEPIDTPVVVNTIDGAAPSSSVTLLAANQPDTEFTVTWSGTDNAGGSGVGSYDIFVSDNGGPFTPFLLSTIETSATFTGEFGHTYRFYSVAIDNVGNAEAPAPAADTLTSVGTFLDVTRQTFTDADGDKYSIRISGGGTAEIIQDPAGHIALLKLTNTTAKTNVIVTVKKSGGDGFVEIGGVLGDGSVKLFNASKAFLTNAGFVLDGTVGKLVLGDVLDGTDISFGGDATKKTAITLGNVSDGSRITTPSQISTLTAQDFGDGRVTAAALGKVITKTGAFDAELRITGAVGPVTVKTGVNGGRWIASSFGNITVKGGAFDADIVATGAAGKLAVKGGGVSGELGAASFGAISITGGSFTGSLNASAAPASLGKKAAITGISITGGDLSGNVTALAGVGNVTVKADRAGAGGELSGALDAASFGRVTVTGGDFSGSLVSTATAATLGKKAALAALTVAGGDITGDVHLLGGLGKLFVKSAKNGPGGNITEATIAANKIAGILVANDIANSHILAGADLGADRVLGGGDDVFGAGAIGAVNVKGEMIASVIAAGLASTNATLGDADDSIVATNPALKLLNSIAKLLIAGGADSASYFAASTFGPKPKVGSSIVDPVTDPRFLIG